MCTLMTGPEYPQSVTENESVVRYNQHNPVYE